MERCAVAHQECCYLHRLTRLLSPTTSSKSAFLYLPVGFRPSPGLLDQGGAHPEHVLKAVFNIQHRGTTRQRTGPHHQSQQDLASGL